MENQQFTKATIGAPEPWLIEAAAGISLNLARFVHEITNQFEDHALNRHGDPAFHGAATITAADFSRIPGIIKAPDMAIIGAKRKERLINVYVKAENGVTYLYFEEILQGRKNKALRGCTFYKVTRPLTVDDILKNVTRNDKTDISGAKVYNPSQFQNSVSFGTGFRKSGLKPAFSSKIKVAVPKTEVLEQPHPVIKKVQAVGGYPGG